MLLDLSENFLGRFGEWWGEVDEIGMKADELWDLHRADGFGH